MAWFLDSLNNNVRFATIPTVTFAGDFEIKYVGTQAGKGTDGTFIFAGTGVVGQNGLDLYRGSAGVYQMYINNSSVFSTSTAVSNNVLAPDTVIIKRVSGVVELLINGVSVGTTSNSATLRVDRLFHRNGWVNYGRMALYEFTIVSGGSYNTSWNAVNSPNSGSTWTSTSGQVLTEGGGLWPTDDSEWIYYNSVIATADISTLQRAINQPVSINLDNYFSGATSYVVQSGSLPTGLSIVDNQIVGTSTSAQTTTLVIRASNAVDFLDSVTITFKTALWLLRFDGATTNHVNIPPVLAGASTFEVEFDVVQRTLSTAFKSVFNSNSGNSFAFYFWNNSSSELSITTGGSRKTIAVGGFVAGQRYVIKATYDGATLRYFVDGVQRGSVAATGAATSGITQLARNIAPSADMDFYRLKITQNEVLVRDYNLYSADGLTLVDTVNNENGTLVNFPTDNSQWVSYDGGGTVSQPVTSINAQQITQAVTVDTSVKQVVAAGVSEQITQAVTVDIDQIAGTQVVTSVNAEQLNEATTASIRLNQSVTNPNTQQLTESNLVTIAVKMGVASVNTQQQTQSVLAAVSVRQTVAAGVSEQITQAVTVDINQGAGTQIGRAHV